MEKTPETLKILELIDTYYPIVDGAINVTKHYCEELNKIAECKLAVPKAAKKDKYEDKETFDVIRCASTGAPEKYRSAFPEQDLRFKRRIREEKFDIMHTHSPFVLGRYALKTARKRGIPIVATLHTQYHQDFERVLKNKALTDFMIWYIVKVFQDADSVWTVSNRSCQILRDYGYNGKIEVVRNGTDYKYPDNPDELIAKVNALHNLDGQKNVFLFVGRMAWYKNLKIILDALKIIKQRKVDFKMLFVGGGFDYEEVKAYAKEQGLENDCIFTGAVADKELIQGYYLRGDLLLFPSTFDMAPVTGVEAAAHNLAAIMTKDSCSAELVVDGENGFLAEESAESFADKICELVNTPELVKQAGINAGKTLYRSWEMVAEEVLEKYKKIVKDYKRKKEMFNELKRLGKEHRQKLKQEKKRIKKEKRSNKER
ncbi:MAG: glycosyltransferase [Clostridia bacterium]|nr:glycosyltransferase [Clostridia bacterium]